MIPRLTYPLRPFTTDLAAYVSLMNILVSQPAARDQHLVIAFDLVWHRSFCISYFCFLYTTIVPCRTIERKQH